MRLSAVEVHRHLKLNTVKIVGDTHIGSIATITHEYDAMTWITCVSQIAEVLVSSDVTLFRFCSLRDGTYAVIGTEHLAQPFLDAIRCAPDHVKKYYPYHSFDPRVEIFFRLLSESPLVKECVQTGLKGLSKQSAKQICDHLNQFVASYRNELGSERFGVLTRRCARRALKNYREMDRYVEKQFSRCSRLLVVRVDLYYPSVQKDGELNGMSVTPAVLRRDRERFVRKLKCHKFSSHLLGYCWKLEYGLTKGFHYHWLFCFDGARVREDITIGRLIGQTWESVQGGTGLYWNCNAAKEKYLDIGIGMISHFDKDRRLGLRKAISYLTKPDYHLSLKEIEGGRTFGKGLIKARPNGKRGRPRVC